MCITDYLRAKAEDMGPREQLTIDREWIDWLLETHTCACEAGTGPGNGPAAVQGYSTAELAKLFDNSPTSIRAWCSVGVFGDPATLKPNGQDWRVPEDRVVELRRRLAEGWRITSGGLVEPGAPSASETPSHRRHTRDEAPRPGTRSRTPPRASRRRRSGRRRHSSWKEHFG